MRDFKKYLIEGVNVSKETDKNNEIYYRCGLLIDSVWYNQNIYDPEIFFLIQKKKPFYLHLYKEEFEKKEYNKFQLPSIIELNELRFNEIMDVINSLAADAGILKKDPEDDSFTDFPF